MGPSIWSYNNQHWIPRFILSGFGTRGNARTIYELDKETHAITLRKVKEVASRPRLLTEQDDQMLRGIENRANAAIESIPNGHLTHIGENERQAVDRLVCAMMMNDPYRGFDNEETRKKALTQVISELKESAYSYGGMLDEPGFTHYFDERMHHDLLSEFMGSTHNESLLALRRMGLRAFRPTDGEFFIIGDSPVLVIRGVLAEETNLLHPGSQILVPISKNCMLFYAWSNEMNLVDDGGILEKNKFIP